VEALRHKKKQKQKTKTRNSLLGSGTDGTIISNSPEIWGEVVHWIQLAQDVNGRSL
jgi:hypothetical protein